jgi:hypothetical protein
MNKLSAWLESHSRWSQLRQLGESGLVKSSVLMPAFGYILLLNENIHQYLTIKYDGWLLNYLPSVWRIWFLFYGSFFLAIGSVLFTRYCPPEIRRYASEFGMATAEREHVAHQRLAIQHREKLQALYNRMSTWENLIFPLPKLKFDQPAYGVESSDIESTLLIQLWTLANIKRPRLRIFILVVFAIGLALLAVPAAFTFLQVTLGALKHLIP